MTPADISRLENFSVWSLKAAPEPSKAIRFLEEYFERQKQGRTFNSRKDLNPADLAIYLPYITLMEAIYADGEKGLRLADARIRLVGTKVALLYGESTGMLVSEHHGAEILGRVRKIADFCIQNKYPAMGRSEDLARGRTGLEVTVLYIPFAEDDEHVTQFLIFADICRLNPDGTRVPGDRLPEPLSEINGK